MDVDKNENIIGLEILSASKVLAKKTLEKITLEVILAPARH